MKKVILTVLTVIAAVAVAVEGFYLIRLFTGNSPDHPVTVIEVDATLATQPEDPTGESTVPETTVEETTVPETTEPEPVIYTLSFAGDCTLGTEPGVYGAGYTFVGTVKDDYAYPLANVKDIFSQDDFTFVNLEGVFCENGAHADNTFVFRGPPEYSNILSEGDVEAVALANNHYMDYGQAGFEATKAALEEVGVQYAVQNDTLLYTTESGLTIGVYACAFIIHPDDVRAEIAALKEQGAEVIIVSVHWGNEGSYRVVPDQRNNAYMFIDAGADIVFGHHPHVLQPVEEYNGGIIYYSLGNFSFGGHAQPKDKDSAILQQQIIRNPDGTVELGELIRIPCWITSDENQIWNNYQPTPMKPEEEGYDRALSKLDGTFTGGDLVVNLPE